MVKSFVLSAVLLSIAMPLSAAEEVNIYSARKEALIKPLLDRFSAESGITVNLLTGKAGALQKKLELEGAHTPADLLVTVDAGNLHRAKAKDLLQAIESDTLESAIPENLRDSDQQWFGLTYRARPIFYVKGKVKPEQLSTYEALAEAAWKGKICIRSSSNIYNQSLVASMLAAGDADKTAAWATSFVNNLARPPKGGDRDQIKAAAAGQCDIAIANSYYYAGMLTGKDEKQKAAAEQVAIFWPNQDDRGTHINVSGIAVTKAAKNKDNAIKLMEFMVGTDAQRWYAEANGEYPVVADIEAGEVLKSWGEFKADAVNLSVLGEKNAEAVKIMDQAGWK